MTEPVLCVEVDERPSAALRLLAGYPVHHLPVVRSGKLVGILSDTDLRKLDAFLPRKGAAADDYLDAHITIEKMMSPPSLTVGPDEPIAAVAARMVQAGVHAAPVVDVMEQVIGILTTTDIINGALQSSHAAGSHPASRTAAAAPQDAERWRALEDVLHVADRYLRGGSDESLHALLLAAVERAKGLSGGATEARAAMHSL